MYTLDINNSKKHAFKTVVTYGIVSILTYIVNKIYGLFGHGVSSASMTWMFLYPFIGGVLIYGLIWFIIPRIKEIPGYRGFYNIYNSGIAILTVASFMRGIFEIAGTDSPYLKYYFMVGWSFIIFSIFLMIVSTLQYKIKL